MVLGHKGKTSIPARAQGGRESTAGSPVWYFWRSEDPLLPSFFLFLFSKTQIKYVMDERTEATPPPSIRLRQTPSRPLEDRSACPHITHMQRSAVSRNKIMYNCHNPDRKGSGWKQAGRKKENEKGGDAGQEKTQQQMVLVSSGRTEGSSESLGSGGTDSPLCRSALVHVHTHQLQGGEFQQGGVIRRKATGARTTYLAPRNQDTRTWKNSVQFVHTHLFEGKNLLISGVFPELAYTTTARFSPAALFVFLTQVSVSFNHQHVWGWNSISSSTTITTKHDSEEQQTNLQQIRKGWSFLREASQSRHRRRRPLENCFQ